MKRAIAYGTIPALIAVVFQTGIAQAATSSTSVHNISQKTISYAGGTSTSAYGFAADDNGYQTTYMPIWYVSAVLQQAGIPSSWNGTTWNLNVPNTFRIDLTNLPAPSSSPYNNTTVQINGQTVMQMHRLAYPDPIGHSLTTYIPIWYIEQALQRIGLQSSWDGTTWAITSTQSFTNVDLRYTAPANITADSINQFLQNNGSPLTGLGQSYIQAQNTYGSDANYLVSHSILESGWGKSQISLAKNNLFGYGAYDANPGNDAGLFPSDEYAIRFEAWVVRQNYLNPSGSLYVSPTLKGMNVNYATDPNWASSIGQIMGQVAAASGGSVTQYTQYQGNSAPAQAPQSDAEPVFYLNGAQGTIQPNPYYNGVPYYPDMGTGMQAMFIAPLQLGSAGSSVAQIQRFLNQQIGAGVKVDGQFGPLTKTAVENFQRQQGQTVNGIWDYALWQLIHPTSTNIIPAGTAVNIDETMQGMANGYVVEWYHIPNYGWVDSQYVLFNNVYRITVPNPQSTQTTVSVYSPTNATQVIATLHSGDFVVASSPNPVNGLLTIQIADQLTGQLMTGVVPAANATLQPQQ